MMSACERVAERIACGEALAELEQHASDCPRCQGLLATERLLTAGVSSSGGSVEPVRGFTARMTAVASHRLVSRHRRRVAGYATLSAAAAAMLTFALVREPGRSSSQPGADEVAAARNPLAPLPAAQPAAQNPWDSGDPGAAGDEDARELLLLARTASLPISADWRQIERPLRPYRDLLQHLDATAPDPVAHDAAPSEPAREALLPGDESSGGDEADDPENPSGSE